ncbi:hypothetical protein PV332_24020, partial [Streptomyces scabiei]|nr:hypothetical protein [Streptomyces scabiei]MDX2656245.1 hypothetical protein [Streptomyces scabiei]MDX2724954.1 hypothetical protein [Streptomyces scabiei]MDX2886928.1 hypothetical protein [Streptomyces scabiei]
SGGSPVGGRRSRPAAREAPRRRVVRGRRRGRVVRIEHATGQQAGLVQLMVEPKAAVVLTGALRERGWAIRQ